MKFVIVLCSFVTFATAVPVYQGNFIESSLNNLPLGTKRERKSAFPETPELSLDHGIEGSSIYNSQQSGHGISKNFKKPIVIKKKLGYHIYRDSDEEMAHAEPGEKCREQVKFKLCDHESINNSKTGVKGPKSTCADVQKSDNEIENSIRMAKEAMEFVQRDLKRMQIFTPKMGSTNLEDIESNSGLHHDIEIAKDALEHFEDNLESIDFYNKKEKELELTKTVDEERLAKWREAIENIHKNFEIVKNIEDAFKSDNYYSSDMADSRKEDELHPKFINNKSENRETNMKDEFKTASQEIFETSALKSKFNFVNSLEKDTNMFTSPFNNKDENMRLHSDSLRSEISPENAKSVDSNESNDNSPKLFKFSESLSTVPENFEDEKSASTDVDDNHKQSPKESNQFRSSNEKQEEDTEQKARYEKEWEMDKTFLPETELPLRKLKTVEEIIERSSKEKAKAATSFQDNKDQNSNHDLKSDNDNISRENRDNSAEHFIAKSTVKEASEKLKDNLESENLTDEEVKKNIKESEVSSTNMRLSNEYLEKSLQQAADDPEIIHEEGIELPPSLMEKHAGFNNENQEFDKNKEFHDSLTVTLDKGKQSDANYVTYHENLPALNDEPRNVKYSALENGQSVFWLGQEKELSNQPGFLLYSENENFAQDQGRMSATQKEDAHLHHLKVFPSINLSDNDQSPTQFKSVPQTDNSHDIVHTVEQQVQTSLHQIEPKKVSDKEDRLLWELKAVPELQNDKKILSKTLENNGDILKDESKLRLSQNQDDSFEKNENNNNLKKLAIDYRPEEHNSQMLKSVPDQTIASPSEDIEMANNQNFLNEHVTSMRSSHNDNEKLQLNENWEAHDQLSVSSNIEKQLEDHTSLNFKSVPVHHDGKILSVLSDKAEITKSDFPDEEETRTRLSRYQNEKLDLKGNQVFEDNTTQLSKSVPELNADEIMSMPSDNKPDSMRLSQNENDKLRIDENQDDTASRTIDSDKEKQLRENTDIENWTSQLSKSVPELEVNEMEFKLSDKTEETNYQRSLKQEEASMRQSSNQNDELQLNDLHEHSPMRPDNRNRIEDHNTSQLTKSVSDLHSDEIVSVPLDKSQVKMINEQNFLKEDRSLRLSQNQDEKLQVNDNQEVQDTKSFPVEKESEDHNKLELFKSVPEFHSDDMVSLPSDKVEKNSEHQSLQEESMRLSQIQNDKLWLNENQDHKNSMSSDSEKHLEDHSTQSSKSVPEVLTDKIVSTSLDKLEMTHEGHSLKEEEANMRLSQNQNERLNFNENSELHDSPFMSSEINKHPEYKTLQLLKSVPEVPSDKTLSTSSDNLEMTHENHPLKEEEANMRLSQNQNERLNLNENHELHDSVFKSAEVDKYPESHTSHLLKSVPENSIDKYVSTSSDKLEMTHENHFLKEEEANMRLSESQNERLNLNENHEVYDSLFKSSEMGKDPEYHKTQVLKSVPEVQSHEMISVPAESDQKDKEQPHLNNEEVNMRLTENQNDKLKIIEDHGAHISLKADLAENIPEESISHLSKSVSEIQDGKMMSMPSEQIHIFKKQDSEEVGKRMSGDENDQINDHQSRTHLKLSVENNPGDNIFQVKSIPELHDNEMISAPLKRNENTNENIVTKQMNTRLSQNHDEQRLNIKNHASFVDTTEAFTSGPELESEGVKRMRLHKVESQNGQFHLKDQEFMRLSQNENENRNLYVHDPNMNIELQSEKISRSNDGELPVKDQTYVSLTQDQQLHKNYNPMMQWAKEKQHLNHASRTMPEYRIVPSINSFELNQRQNAPNEHINMRINQETMENQNVHNSFTIPWNTEKRLQDDSQKAYDSASDIAHEHLYNFKSSEIEDGQYLSGDVAKMRNIQGYQTKQQFDEHNLDTQSMRWVHPKQHNNHFSKYYKTTPEIHDEYEFNPHFHRHFHRVPAKQRFHNLDAYSSHDYPSTRSRLHDHMLMYHQGKSSDIDSSIESSMHTNVRDPLTDFGHHHQYFSHPHGTARFGTSLPLASAGTGAVGVFPTANAGGCGIPLLLSCSPSVVSGSLAKSHIAGPAFKSEDENEMYYMNMKRDTTNVEDLPIMKIQKSHNHNQVPIHNHE